MSQIPLKRAYLCLDCEYIGDCSEHCTTCPSKTVYPVSSFLNRENLEPKLSAFAHTCVDRPNLPCRACNL